MAGLPPVASGSGNMWDTGNNYGIPSGGGGGGSMNWMSMLSGLLPMLGNLFGGNQAAQAQGDMSSQLMNMISGMQNDFSNFYQPAMAGESASVMNDLASSSGNMAQSNAVYSQEAKTGLNPQVALNAQSQLLQGYDSSMNDMRSQAAPGANMRAAGIAGQNNYLTQATNLSGQLAQESQTFMNQGAAGLASNEGQAMQAANAFTGQGINMMNDSMSSLADLYKSYSQQLESGGGQSNSGIGGMLSGIGSILPLIGMFA